MKIAVCIKQVPTREWQPRLRDDKLWIRDQDVSYELVESLREPVRRLGRVDVDLARQVRRAASSIALNLGEGNGRAGKDRLHSFRIARGSAFEVEAGLRVAIAWGYLPADSVARCLTLLRTLLALLRGLLR